jgi:uncharacterized membrane protein
MMSSRATPRNGLFLAQVAIAVAGLAVAIYLTIIDYSDVKPFCTGFGGCTSVQSSPYAFIGPVPVALLGVVGYMVLLALRLVKGQVPPDLESYVPLAAFGASLIGVLYSAYLTYLEAFVILAWCPWCVTSAILMAAYFVLAVIDWRQSAVVD